MSTPLYCKTVYSLLSSLCPIPKLVAKAKEYGYHALAITDFNVLSGAMQFQRECEAQNIKPIYGMEIMVVIKERSYPLLLLAKNDEGYLDLMHLSSFLNCNSEKELPVESLKKYSENCFVIAFSDHMYATSYLLKKEKVEEAFQEQIAFLGENHLIALCDNDKAFCRNLNLEVKKMCDGSSVKTLALHRTFYIEEEDSEAYTVLTAIRDKKLMKDPDLLIEEGRYLLDEKTFSSLYEEEDLLYTDFIASRCNVKMAFLTSLPLFQTPKEISSKDYLINLCKAGLSRRLKGRKDAVYEKRLLHELKIIVEMHFEDYFLIVYDFILYAKKHNILVGPGRGSAAGSLVSYCLGITDIDPIRYGLIFERFLNPERITMPDIDVDFPDERRDEVIYYVKEKYGKDHVGHIITYGTLKAKQVLRDVGRVMSYPNHDIDALCKLIPFDPKMNLLKAYEGSSIFRQKIESESRFKELFRICLKLEGFPRHESTHAAGIVMSQKPLQDIVPLCMIEQDLYSTQYTMEHLEKLGLIKMDFLGLRNLSIIHEIVEEIKKDENDFRLSEIPLDDQKTFDLIKEVNTLGIFQLESSGMQNLIRRFGPESFEEIALTIALFRPGPMENIPLFIENRAHKEKISYLHPDLKEILEETYGIIVYQEQIMRIAQKMAGFTYAKADILRKAMSKKKESELIGLSKEFIDGCVKRGYDKELSERLYELILKFANYGFNKSHSIAYARIAYEMAYLKANYPLYFYKALLNGVIGSETKTYEYLVECMKINVKLKGFSINHSTASYIIDQDSILMPLSIIKEVGQISVKTIIEERVDHGPYHSYEDVVIRLNRLSIGKNVIENLIHAGTLDEFGYSRKTMMMNLAIMLKFADTYKKGQMSFHGFDVSPNIEVYQDDTFEKARLERSVLGFYFSVNPILEFKKEHHIDTKVFSTLAYLNGYQKGFGIVHRVKEHRTKKGDWMAFVEVHDETGNMDLVIMPNLYRVYQDLLHKGQYLYFEGMIEKEASCLVKKLEVVEGKKNA